MKNIIIEAQRPDYIIVKADTFRFGKNEVMFEGNTFEQCFNYIKKETHKQKLQLTSSFMYEPVKDRTGRTFPWYMEVVL